MTWDVWITIKYALTHELARIERYNIPGFPVTDSVREIREAVEWLKENKPDVTDTAASGQSTIRHERDGLPDAQ